MPIQGALPAGTQSSCGTGGIHRYLHFVRGVVGRRGGRQLCCGCHPGSRPQRPPLSPTRPVKLASFKIDPLDHIHLGRTSTRCCLALPSIPLAFLRFGPWDITLGPGSKDNWFPARGPAFFSIAVTSSSSIPRPPTCGERQKCIVIFKNLHVWERCIQQVCHRTTGTRMNSIVFTPPS